MHPDDDLARPQDHGPGEDARVRGRFDEIVTRLRDDDPSFVRRCSAPRPGSVTRTDARILTAVLALIVVGVVPLGVGIHLHAVALLAVGTVGCLLAPTVLPWVVGRTIERRRPLWT